MAKINLSGISVQDIIDPNSFFVKHINEFTREELSQITGRLVSASNKRLRNLAKSEFGKLSPAYSFIKKYNKSNGGMFSVKGKSLNQIRETFAVAKGFLQAKTSSVYGWKNIRTGVEERLGISLGGKRKAKQFWKTYRKAYEAHGLRRKGETKSRLNSDQIQELVANIYNQKGGFNQSIDSVLEKLDSSLTDIYEQETEEERKFDLPNQLLGNYDEDEEDEDEYDLEI